MTVATPEYERREDPGRAAAPGLAGIDHVGLTVRDVASSEDWYRRVLGFVRAFVEPHPGGSGYAVVMTKPGTGLFVGLDHHDEADRAVFSEHRTGLDHLALRVSSRSEVDQWAAHLDELHVQRGPIVDVAEPFPHALFSFRDLDGIALEVIWVDA